MQSHASHVLPVAEHVGVKGADKLAWLALHKQDFPHSHILTESERAAILALSAPSPELPTAPKLDLSPFPPALLLIIFFSFGITIAIVRVQHRIRSSHTYIALEAPHSTLDITYLWPHCFWIICHWTYLTDSYCFHLCFGSKPSILQDSTGQIATQGSIRPLTTVDRAAAPPSYLQGLSIPAPGSNMRYHPIPQNVPLIVVFAFVFFHFARISFDRLPHGIQMLHHGNGEKSGPNKKEDCTTMTAKTLFICGWSTFRLDFPGCP